LPAAALAQVKNVAVVETEVDAQSGTAAEITSAEVRLITAGLRRKAVKNLPRNRYNIMTSETVQAQGGAVLEACADENCVISLGAKIGADYIVRGIISKLRARFALSVEIYETENGNLVASSDLVSSENIVELVEKTATTCAEMYKTFANAHRLTQKKTITHTIAVNINPDNGGIVSRYSDQTYYAPGTVVYLTATSADGYNFAGWSGSATDTVNPVTVTMDGDKGLTANFYKKNIMASMSADEDTATKIFVGYDDDGKPIYRKKRAKRINLTKEDYMADTTKNSLFIDAVHIVVSIATIPYTFGFGLQYERKLNEKLSLVGRYDYFGIIVDDDSYYSSFETHARYYPTGKMFFLDGMLGYVNTDYMNYYKSGAQLGWQIRFRKVGGFTWELSLGWTFPFYPDSYRYYFFEPSGRGLLMGGGGPRLVSAFGWRF